MDTFAVRINRVGTAPNRILHLDPEVRLDGSNYIPYAIHEKFWGKLKLSNYRTIGGLAFADATPEVWTCVGLIDKAQAPIFAREEFDA